MKTYQSINFNERFYDLIRRGWKTQTRRLRKGELTCRYGEPGHSLRITGTDMRIRVCAVCSERLDDISLWDVQAEGFESHTEFYDAWREIHPKSKLREQVWVIKFFLEV